jgi:hypothetical protein
MPPPETSSASAWRTGISIGQQQQRLPPPQQPPQTAEDRGGSAPTDGDAAYVQGLVMDMVGAPRSSLAAVAGAAAAAAAAAPLPSELPPPPPPDPHLIMGHPEGAHHPGNPHTTPRKQRTPLPVLGGSQGGATKRRRSGEDDGAGMLCTAAGSFEGELFQVLAEPVVQHGVAAAAGGALGVCPSMAATDAVMAGEAGVHGLGIQQEDVEEDDDDNEMLLNRGPSPSTVEAVQHLVQMDIGGMNDHEDHGGMFLASCCGGASTAAGPVGVTGGGATTEDILGSMPLGGTDAISRGILSQHGVAHAVGEPSLHSSVDDDGVGAGGSGGGGGDDSGQNTLVGAGGRQVVPPPWSSRPPPPCAPPPLQPQLQLQGGGGPAGLGSSSSRGPPPPPRSPFSASGGRRPPNRLAMDPGSYGPGTAAAPPRRGRAGVKATLTSHGGGAGGGGSRAERKRPLQSGEVRGSGGVHSIRTATEEVLTASEDGVVVCTMKRYGETQGLAIVATNKPPSRPALDAGTKCRAELEFPPAVWHEELQISVLHCLPQPLDAHAAHPEGTAQVRVVDTMAFVPARLPLQPKPTEAQVQRTLMLLRRCVVTMVTHTHNIIADCRRLWPMPCPRARYFSAGGQKTIICARCVTACCVRRSEDLLAKVPF